MIDKSLKIVIEMIKKNKNSYSSTELQTFLKLKYVEGVYPHLKKLNNNNLIKKVGVAEYSLNNSNEKIRDLKLIHSTFQNKTNLILDKKTKNLIKIFAHSQLIKHKDIIPKNKKLINELLSLRILGQINRQAYYLKSWEDHVKKILNFFNIHTNYNTDELKINIGKFIESQPNTYSPIEIDGQKELKKINLDYYFLEQDYILNKLKNIRLNFLITCNKLTNDKKKEFESNLFKFTTKLSNWKFNYIYNTDKIEGNALTLPEVKTILTGGNIINSEKKDFLETTNSRTALEIIFNTENELTENFIKKLNLATQNGIDENAGNYKKRENCITDNNGNIIDKTTPVQFVEERMQDLIKWYEENKKNLHPLIIASIIHNQFVYIHPFDDGNGRVARLLFNFILMKNGLFPIIFYNSEKQDYYNYLRSSKSGDMKSFILYSLNLYKNQLKEF